MYGKDTSFIVDFKLSWRYEVERKSTDDDDERMEVVDEQNKRIQSVMIMESCWASLPYIQYSVREYVSAWFLRDGPDTHGVNNRNSI